MKKKSILVLIIFVMLAVIMAATPTLQVAAEQAQGTPGATGSVTTPGYLILAGVGGLALGVIATLCIVAVTKKKKKESTPSE